MLPISPPRNCPTMQRDPSDPGHSQVSGAMPAALRTGGKQDADTPGREERFHDLPEGLRLGAGRENLTERPIACSPQNSSLIPDYDGARQADSVSA